MDCFIEQEDMLPDFKDFVALYPYGSRVYGTSTPDSDYDFVAIQNGATDTELTRGTYDLRIMSPEHFQGLLNQHHIVALECFYLPEQTTNLKLPTTPWQFKLDLSTLRHSLGQKSSHSWVKAKKKFEAPYEWAENERIRGKKSLFHSFRILDFGIQIAREGKIIDYSSANHFYHEIMKMESVEWKDYEEVFKARHNSLASEFRKVAPK